MPKKTPRNGMFWFGIFVFFCVSVYVLRSVLLPFVAGIIIGYLFDPLATKIQKLGVKNRTLSTSLVLLLVTIILVPTLFLVIGLVEEQLSRFLTSLPVYASNLANRLEPVFIDLQDKFPNIQAEKIREFIRGNMANNMKIAGKLLQKIISGGFALVNLFSLILITPIVAFYMLRDWHTFQNKVKSLLPRNYKDTICSLSLQIDKILAGFIRGQLTVCFLLGFYYACGLYAIGLELGILVGFIAGMISFIPYVGCFVGLLVSLGLAFAQFGTYNSLLQVVIVFVIGQFLEGNFLTPKLVGDNVRLHPVWIMFALLAGGVLLGFLGMMIAVPVAAIVGVLIRFGIEEGYKKSDLYLG